MKNDPNKNYALYEADRESKRKAQHPQPNSDDDAKIGRQFAEYQREMGPKLNASLAKLVAAMREKPEGYYSRAVTKPDNMRQGLANCVQMAINLLAAGDSGEALYLLVDLLDDIRSNANPYELKGGAE